MTARLGSLDSLRGFLVLCILIYHYSAVFHPGTSDFLEGGFLAVEVFILLSGYLITHLLLKRGGSGFLVRRFLRLYPSMIFMTISVLLVIHAGGVEPLSFAFKEALYALLSVYNYFLVLSEIPYFDRFEKEVVFLPLWSLSMEFQFYLLSFLLFLTLPRRLLPHAFASLALISSLISFYYFQIQNANPDHVYFRTEARAHAFFIGGLLAFYEEKVIYALQRAGRTLRVLFFISVSSLLLFTFLKFSIYTDWFFPFGFLLVDVLSVGLVACLLYIRRGFGPLYLLGRISYPLFLWHYPLMLLTKHAGIIPHCPQCVMFLVIFGMSLLTHWLIEEPFRKAGSLRLIPELAVRASLSLGLIPAIMTLYRYTEPEKTERLSASIATADIPAEPVPDASTRRSECVAFMIGDSVMKGAGPFLVRSYGGLIIDARVNRWFTEALEVIGRKADTIKRCNAVVVHLGHNGYPRREIVERFIEQLRAIGVGEIYFVNLRASRLRWEESYNALLRELQSDGQIKLIDWHSLAKPEYLHRDGIHLNMQGARAYARMIAEFLSLGGADASLKSVMVRHEPEKKERGTPSPKGSEKPPEPERAPDEGQGVTEHKPREELIQE